MQWINNNKLKADEKSKAVNSLTNQSTTICLFSQTSLPDRRPLLEYYRANIKVHEEPTDEAHWLDFRSHLMGLSKEARDLVVF